VAREGRSLSPYTLVKYWHDSRKAAGLPKLRFHDLRHTAVWLLLALGVPPHVVREIAGHIDIKVTMTADPGLVVLVVPLPRGVGRGRC
jgi:integrase